MPFRWVYDLPELTDVTLRTDVNGQIVANDLIPGVLVISYVTEIAWSDTPAVAIVPGDVFFLSAGDDMHLAYLLVAPERAEPGDAAFELIVMDCSEGNPDDIASCNSIPGLPFIYEYRGINGRFTDVGVTDITDVSYVINRVSVPGEIAIAFTLDYTDFDLVTAEQVQTTVMLAGDTGQVTFIFVAEDDDAVTELPDTGTGMGRASPTDWVAWLLLSGVLTGFAGVSLRRRTHVLTH